MAKEIIHINEGDSCRLFYGLICRSLYAVIIVITVL